MRLKRILSDPVRNSQPSFAFYNNTLKTYDVGELRAQVASKFFALLLADKETIEHAQQTATEWLWRYNHERPNMDLGGITPNQMLANAA